MKTRLLLTLFTAFVLASYGASGGGISLVGVEISTQQSTRSGSDDIPISDASTLAITEGDIITVVGAQDANITFRYNGEKWLTDKEYAFRDNISAESPFYLYYGKDAYVDTDAQLNEILFATCTEKPKDGKIELTSDNKFKRYGAQVRVVVKNWEKPQPPVVMLRNFHNIEYVKCTGEYVFNPQRLSSIVFVQASKDGDADYTFTANVPSGSYDVPNIIKGYSLVVDGISIFNYLADDSSIPQFFASNERYTFTLDFATPATN